MGNKTDSVFSSHFFRTYATLVTGTVVLLLGALVFGFISNLHISKSLRRALGEIALYEGPEKNPPSAARLAFLESAIQSMETYLDEYRNWPFLKDTRAGKRSGDAFEFKESLYHVEQQLRAQGAESGIEWPASFGFERFQNALPSAEDLSDLFYQEELFDKIGAAIVSTAEDAPGLPGVSGAAPRFLQSGKNRGQSSLPAVLPEVKAVPARDLKPSAGGGDAERRRPLTGKVSVKWFNFKAPVVVQPEKEAARTHFTLELNLEGSYEQIAKFLDQIRRLPHLVIVEKLTIKPTEDDPAFLEAEFEIRAVYL